MRNIRKFKFFKFALTLIFITLLTSCSNIGNSFCTHELGEWTTVVEATCETNGKEVQSCNLCGIEVNSREIPKSEHKEGDWIVDKEPTCTEEGHKYKKCTSCGTVVESQSIGKVGHITSDWIVDKEPTCTEEGHKYKKCTSCGTVVESQTIGKVGHITSDWIVDKEPTCTEEGHKYKKCTSCGTVVESQSIGKVGHITSDWIVDKEPTCTEEGHKYKKCTECGDIIEYEYIPILNHNYVGEHYIPKCMHETGVTTAICTQCNDKKTYTWDEITIEVYYTSYTENGNTYYWVILYDVHGGRIDVDSNGNKVNLNTYSYTITNTKVGGLMISDTMIEGKNNGYPYESYISNWSEYEIVVSDGYTECTFTTSQKNKTPVLKDRHRVGETPLEWKLGKEATCTEDGYYYQECDFCNQIFTDSIKATGHQNTKFVVETAATCTTDGIENEVCLDCGETLSSRKIPARGHDFVGVAHGAACNKNGYTHQTCTVCGYETDEQWDTFSNETRIENNGDGHWNGVHKSFLGFSTRISGGCDPKIGTNLTIIINEITTGTRLLSTTVKYYGSYYYDSGTLRLPYDASFNFTFTVSISTTDNVQYSFFCKYSIVFSEVVTYPHHECGEWILEKEATCTENGNRYHECSICGERFNQAIPAKGHTLSDWIIDEEATCEHDGRRHKVCSVCNAIVNEEVIPSVHNYKVVSRTSTSLDLRCKTCGVEKHYEFTALSVSGEVTGVGQMASGGNFYNTNDITAKASGGYGTNYQFRFELYRNTTFIDSQDYSKKNTFKALMTYGYSGFKIKIYVKDELDNVASVSYSLN